MLIQPPLRRLPPHHKVRRLGVEPVAPGLDELGHVEAEAGELLDDRLEVKVERLEVDALEALQRVGLGEEPPCVEGGVNGGSAWALGTSGGGGGVSGRGKCVPVRMPRRVPCAQNKCDWDATVSSGSREGNSRGRGRRCGASRTSSSARLGDGAARSGTSATGQPRARGCPAIGAGFDISCKDPGRTSRGVDTYGLDPHPALVAHDDARVEGDPILGRDAPRQQRQPQVGLGLLALR